MTHAREHDQPRPIEPRPIEPRPIEFDTSDRPQHRQRADVAATRLGGLLEDSHRTIGVAESLTGGLLVQALARQQGSGGWLAGGVVAYQRSVKHDLLDVGAAKVVSREAAAQMAVGARRCLNTDISIAATGVGGPASQDGEPQGTLWLAVDVGNGPVTHLVRLDDEDPETICSITVAEAIEFVVREIVAESEGGQGGVTNQGAAESGHRSPIRSFCTDNALSLVCGALFVIFLIAQSLTGWRSSVADAVEHGGASFSYWKYLASAHFAEATFENWESEFFQMGAFVFLTIFLVQKGSAESKSPEGDAVDDDPRHHRTDPDAPWPVRRGGPWLTLYSHSLLIAFTLMFAASFVGHAISGAREFSSEQQSHGASGVTTWEFVQGAEFWFQSFQNWQSEFLAVGSIVVLTIFLRQRGSAESKPVHAPHSATGD